jgi:hypothetical protein
LFSIPPHPNQNLAREIMELFSLGVTHPITGAPNYTQDDIVDIARALTGYLLNFNTQAVYFDSRYWDSGNKTFLGAARGAAALPDVVNAIATQDSFKYFIPRRLYRELTGLEPSAATLSDLANVWGADGDMNGLISAIVHRPEFLDDATIGNKVKSPIELLVSTFRVLGYQNISAFSPSWLAGVLGQHPVLAPNVAGWTSPWLHPTYIVLWSNVVCWLCFGDAGDNTVAPGSQSPTLRALFAQGTSSTGGALALTMAGLHDVSSQTSQAVAAYAASGTWTFPRACGTMQMALESPEFLVS